MIKGRMESEWKVVLSTIWNLVREERKKNKRWVPCLKNFPSNYERKVENGGIM
jgi:hypothetical protein